VLIVVGTGHTTTALLCW